MTETAVAEPKSTVNKLRDVALIVGKDDGYEATYVCQFFKRKLTPETIEELCGRPHLAYRFENKFDHFLIYRVRVGYSCFEGDDSPNQNLYQHPELVEIKEGDFGEASARERCLELLLGDKDNSYKPVLVRRDGSLEIREVGSAPCRMG